MKTELVSVANSRWLLIFVILVASVLRLFQLNINPPSLTPDEAAIGYNAYSILKTARDEHGEFLPIIFKSFGDYKPGLLIYATVPFVAIFGLNEWSVRLPNAISGIIAVYLIYKIIELIERVFSNESRDQLIKTSSLLPTLASIFLAISPWHIAFSRGAWEANFSLTLTLAGIFFFLRGVLTPFYFIVSSLLFSLTLLTYQGAKLSTAIVLIILVSVYKNEILQDFNLKLKYLFVSILLAIFVSIPIFTSFLDGKTGRLEVFSVFSYPRSNEYLQAFLDNGEEKIGTIDYYLYHSEVLNFARGIAGRWFNHFSGRFLFFEGDWQNPRHLPPNQGVLLLADILLLVVGIFGLTKTGNKKLKVFIILWLILSPLPAVLSRDQVQAVRSLNMVIPLTLVCSLGLLYILLIIKNYTKIFRFVVYSLLTMVYMLSFIYFLDAYFIHQPLHNAKHWMYGYKQVVESLTPYLASDTPVIFQQSYSQPYIYYLFYTNYDPRKLHDNNTFIRIQNNPVDVLLVKAIDTISFEEFGWPKVAIPGTVIIGDEVSIPPDFAKWKEYSLIDKIDYPNGSTAFTIVQVKGNEDLQNEK
jgi:4-amino-4-deoxy-L-arabinose transferase-like glycosyltransferase